MSEETPSKWEQARRPGVELAEKLAVHPRFGGEAELVVDCEAIMRSENDVQYWVLRATDNGLWFHGPSGGDPTSLAEQLHAIAHAYTDRVNP